MELLARRIRGWRVQTLKQSQGTGPDGFRLVFGDRNLDVARALACPGHSFGDMGGGFDKVVDDFHGGLAQPAMVQALATPCFGELAVGCRSSSPPCRCERAGEPP